MSDEEEIYSEDELASMYEDDPNQLTPEDVFSMIMINKVKGVKTKTTLVDQDGDQVDLVDTIEQLLKYMKAKVEDGENQFADQVLPLMGQALTSTLSRIIGIAPTGFYLANDMSRTAFLYSMAMGFLLLKFVQDKKITINSEEEPISEMEIEELEQRSQANSAAMLASMIGEDPKDVLKNMLDEGKITTEDLKELLGDTDGEDKS